MKTFFKRFASLKVSACLLVAFLLLTFWGVMAQANAEAAGLSVEFAANRFFNSFFVMALGVVPIPAFKTLATVSVVHLVASMAFRMPRVRGISSGWRNLGLYGMHVALVLLLLGSLVGSGLRQEFNGFGVVTAGGGAETAGVNQDSGTSQNIETAQIAGTTQEIGAAPLVETAPNLKFFAADDSLGNSLVKIPVIANESGVGVDAAWPYFVQYRGYVEMAPGKNVAMYKAFYDPLHCTPYVFMVLFLLSAAFHYAVKKRHGRRLPKESDENTAPVTGTAADICKPLAVLVFCGGIMAVAPASAMSCDVREAHTQEVETLLSNPATAVTFNGEVRSFDAFARGVLDDFSGKVRYKCAAGETENCPRKMPAFEVVRNMIVFPEKAAGYKIFKVLRSDVSEALRLPKDARYVSYAEIAPSRGELEIYASRNDKHPATAEMKRLYANVRLYESITNYETFRNMAGLPPFGTSPNFERVVTRLPENADVNESRLSLEVFYHKANFCLWAFILAFTGGLLAAVNLAVNKRKLDMVSNAMGMGAAAFLCVMLALRLYITQRIPLANLYEIILMVALLLEVFEAGAFLFCKKRTFALMVPVAFMAALLLFFAKFVLETGDTFQAIPAVLNSSVFLTIHVFTIAVGFTAMILSGVVAHLHLFRLNKNSVVVPSVVTNEAECTDFSSVISSGAQSAKSRDLSSSTSLHDSNLERLLYATLVFGSVFTILGTLLGGVWADFAWGRFWGFDPKECGALFVCLWAMLSLHLRAGHLVGERGFAIFNSFNIIVTFLCWFGINLLGVGLHSYGFQSGTALWLLGFVAFDAVLIVFFSKKKN